MGEKKVKNEIMVDINKAVNGLGKTATRESMIKAFNDTAMVLKRSGWATAVTIYKTVKHEKFEKYFDSIPNYADAIGYKKDYVYKQSRAVEIYGLLNKISDAYANISVGYAVEFISLSKEVTHELLCDFIDMEGITPDMSRDDIRNAVKHYKSIINGGGKIEESSENVDGEDSSTEDEKSDESSGSTVEYDEDDMCILTDYELGSIVINNPQLREELKELLGRYGVI